MILEHNINTLDLDNKVILILNQNNINKIKDLWTVKRDYLKSIGLNDNEIRNIIVKMQLCGLDLNKRVYK